jgi:hypothetical protein
MSRCTFRLAWIALFCCLIMGSAVSVSADARPGTGRNNQPESVDAIASISPVVTEYGLISLSIDGRGSLEMDHIIQVEKPEGATVRSAYMAAASTGLTGYQIMDDEILIEGQGVAWDMVLLGAFGALNHWADVTALVAPIVDAAPAGIIDITVTESNPALVDGEILVVIFDDPNQTSSNTVVLLFGAQEVTGDTFAIGLADPINLATPGLVLDLSLGISYSYQVGDQQYSEVDVNGQRMTTAAGGEDDGQSANGALLTVGGIGDTNDNPPDPWSLPNFDFRYDDELYNLIPFVNDGDTSIQVFTRNPSYDDNIFFAALFLGATTAVVGEGAVLGPASATNCVGDPHTVTATVQDEVGNPLTDREVTFTVLSGPHQGTTGTDVTDENGQASFTYTGSVAGTDVLQATFTGSAGTPINSNQVAKIWETCPTAVSLGGIDASPASMPLHRLLTALFLGTALGMIGLRFRDSHR